MLTSLQTHESLIRLLIFTLLFSLFTIAEIYRPRRQLTHSKKQRWQNNLALTCLNAFTLKLTFPFMAIETAIWAQQIQFGLFHQINISPILSGIVGFILLDGIIWAQHYASHRLPILWRFHAIHHTDKDLDVSSAGRFHPLEMVASMGLKMCMILLLGVPPLTVLLFEITLSSMALFNHSNIHLSTTTNRRLSYLLVTPDIHRVHHSVLPKEIHSNFGFNLVIWDKLFHTFCPSPRASHQSMRLGLIHHRDDQDVVALHGLLCSPFRSFKPQRTNNVIEQ